MSVISFEDSWKQLSMIGANESGLYYLNQTDIENNYIRFFLEEAAAYRPTAVYITKLENQTPKPQIYIYDNTDNHLSSENIHQLHKELWNSAKVPMFFIFNHTEVKIYNSRKYTGDNLSTMEILNLASTAQKEINKRKFFNAIYFRLNILRSNPKKIYALGSSTFTKTIDIINS